jgi:phosphoribosyl-AMP cyclohydrolase
MSNEPFVDDVRFDDDGLVPVIVQDATDDQVLMLAYMTAETLRQTLATGRMTYWSRSRQAVWVKGATSGHTQEVAEARIDCDGDTLLFKVHQHGGAACHTGHRSCFYRRWHDGTLVRDGERVFDPEDVYGVGE